MKLNKQFFIAIVVLSIGTSVYAACANREKNENSSDLYEDIKCGLSSASDKLKDGVSTVGSSLKDGTSKAFDAISKAAVKTGSVLRDGLNVAVETGKSGYGIVRDVITGKKTPEHKDIEESIDVRMLKTDEP
jgi:hypothetical protein